MGPERRILSERDLERAAARGLITAEQALALRAMAQERAGERAELTFQHLAYYLGGLIVIGAMGWFITRAWDDMRGLGHMGIAALYAVFFLLAGEGLWRRDGYRIPGGVLVTLAVCMTPMFVYGLESELGVWQSGPPILYRDFFTRIRGHWLVLELATTGAALLALRRYPFPLLSAPAAVSLWFLSMDLAPLLFGQLELTANQRAWTSACVGAAMLWAAFQVDRRVEQDFAFWGYLFGLAALWGGVSMLNSTSELAKFGYCLFNLALIIVAIPMQRKVFLVFGALGLCWYLGHLAERVFKDSLLFPVALSAIGGAVIACGIVYQRRRASIEKAVLRFVPERILRALPANRSTDLGPGG